MSSFLIIITIMIGAFVFPRTTLFILLLCLVYNIEITVKNHYLLSEPLINKGY
jgi:hypothetical protein